MNTLNRMVPFVVRIALCLIAAAALCACGGKADLSLKFKPGDSRVVRSDTSNTMKMSLMGQNLDMTQSFVSEALFEVQEVDPQGAARIKITYQNVLADMVSPMQNFMPDGMTNPMTELARAVKGQSITATITPKGEVRGIEGIGALVDHVAQNAGLPDGPMKAMARGMAEQFFGEEAMRSGLETLLNVYPAQPVKVGDSWSKTRTVNAGFPMTAETKYTLKAREKGVAVIDTVSTFTPDGATSMEMMGASMRFNVNGEQTGEIRMDEATGWTIKGSDRFTMKGDVSASGQGIPGGFNMPIEITGASTYDTFSQ